jgi:hypothetical protein
MASKGFYDTWPEDYLQALFQHRQDPRSWVINLPELILPKQHISPRWIGNS